MKTKYYDPYNTNEERLRHKPPHLLDFLWGINFWGTPEAKVNIMIFFSYRVSHKEIGFFVSKVFTTNPN